MGANQQLDRLEQLAAASAEARELLQEMHGLIKSLRQAIKEGREFLNAEMAGAVDERLSAHVAVGLEQYGAAVIESQRAAEVKVTAEINKLVNLALGKPGTEDDLRQAIAAMIRKRAARE